MISLIKRWFDSAATYIIGFGAILVFSMFAVIKYLYDQLKKVNHVNSILERKEEIDAEQKIAESEIMNNEEERIKLRVEKFKTVNKGKRARLRNL